MILAFELFLHRSLLPERTARVKRTGVSGVL